MYLEAGVNMNERKKTERKFFDKIYYLLEKSDTIIRVEDSEHTDTV